MEAVGLSSELLLSSKETGTTTSLVITFPEDQLMKYDPSLSSYKTGTTTSRVISFPEDQPVKYGPSLSSYKTGSATSLVITFPKDQLVTNNPSLSSYKSACQDDPELKSFHSSLCERTSKLITTVTSQGGKTANPFLDSLTPICDFLGESMQNLSKVITGSKYDLSKNTELNSLVDLFFGSTTKILNLFNTVQKCVGKAKGSQLLIRYAIKLFEKESTDTDFGGNKNKYAKTLKGLKEVIKMEDPFGEEFAKQYEAVYKEQEMIFEKISGMQVELEKNHKELWRLRNSILGSALCSVIAFSMHFVVLPLVKAAKDAFGVTIPIPALWKAISDGMLNDFKTHNNLLVWTLISTKVNTESMETVKIQINKLIDMVKSMLHPVVFAVNTREEEAVKLAMQEIIQDVEKFTKQIEQIGANVDLCIQPVVCARNRVMQHIANPVVESDDESDDDQCTIC